MRDMRVKCIKNNSINGKYKFGLTIGRWYDVRDSDFNYYILVDDSGYRHALSKSLFITECEIRDSKLVSLGI